jgi:hypothetical protein
MKFQFKITYILLLVQCCSISFTCNASPQTHEAESDNSLILKLKTALLSIIGVTPSPPQQPPPPISPPRPEPNYVAKMLNDLPLPKVATFNEISMKDIPEKVPLSPSLANTYDDGSFMSRLMDLNKISKSKSNTEETRNNFLEKLIDIFFKRSEEKRGEFENKDFGSLLYLGKRSGGHKFNYADMYNGNKQQQQQQQPINEQVQEPKLLRPINGKPIISSPLLTPLQQQQWLNFLNENQQRLFAMTSRQRMRRDVDVDTLKFLADLQL